MVISELGIGDDVKLVESHPFENEQTFVEANPLGKVPCLYDNGESIVDSEVICDYLDATYSGGTLFNPVYADWRLKSLFSVCSGLMDTLVARRMEVMRDKEGLKSEFWWQRFNQAIERTLSYLESKLALVPAEFSVLHINLFCCLAYLDFRHDDIEWRNSKPKLRAFFEQYSQRESIRKNPVSE